jgi:hypothetical protein
VGIEKLSGSIEKNGAKRRAILSKMWMALSCSRPEPGAMLRVNG